MVVLENCSLTSAAVTGCLKAGVDVCFVSSGGDFLGKIEPVMSKNVSLRRAHYAAAADPEFCLALAKRFVAGKLANMRTIIMRYARDPARTEAAAGAEALKSAARAAGAADTLSQLMGAEGIGTKEYFGSFKCVLQPPFVFEGRNRRPPRDPVNAMLSFAYALLENVVERAVSSCGLDPYCGFLHAERFGRQSLVLDLMEELRPVLADSVVINCCNRGMLSPDSDFEPVEGGIYLNEAGRQKLFRAFHARMRESVRPPDEPNAVTYDRVCHLQAGRLAKCVRSRVPDYEPFLVK